MYPPVPPTAPTTNCWTHLLLLPLEDGGGRRLRLLAGAPAKLDVAQEHDVVRGRLDVRQGDAALHDVLRRRHLRCVRFTRKKQKKKSVD